MDTEYIKSVIELVGTLPIAELELQQGDTRIRIVRISASAAAVPPQPHADIEPSASELADPVASVKSADVLLSPMVGTFYRRPAPTEAPFVEVGSRVEKGATLALIEAMKTLNAVVAERSGVVQEIQTEDGVLVEEGQPLFVIAQA